MSFLSAKAWISSALLLRHESCISLSHLIGYGAGELKIKETTEAAAFSYLDWYLYIDSGKLTTRLYDKRDDFNFPIVNFPFLSSNIPSAPAYGVYVSQLIRYARACSNYQGFMERGKVLTTKMLSQGYQKTKRSNT